MSGAGGRETFASRFGILATMIGVAVGLGDVWRFPYMVGRFGGAAFVLVYVAAVVLVGVPALAAEWALGRETRRGPVGAFAGAGFPLGRPLGWLFFFGVTAATAYYSNALGWVFYYALGEAAHLARLPWSEGAVLPPEAGFDGRSFALQIAATGAVLLACAWVLSRGLRAGIERASKVIMPALAAILLVLVARSLTLPGSWAGVEWYVLKVDLAALTPGVALAALGHTCFSMSLGGTFMVVYGSYLDRREPLVRSAVWTAAGDLGAGLLAGLGILPAVFAFGLEPASGPGLLFFTLPQVFAAMPAGALFGLAFFAGLLGAAWLSDVAALEVLVAGLTDSTGLSRRQAVWTMTGVVFLFALPPMLNMRVFVPWDLAFGSGFQTLGALFAVLAVGWSLGRARALAQLAGPRFGGRLLFAWLRFVVPGAILAVGLWWLLSDVLAVAGG
jgi:NSS family neurotransmitter:Na+ symporter